MRRAGSSRADVVHEGEAAVLIAQVTDCHIGFDREDPDELNTQRLRWVLDVLQYGPNRPDLLLLTGDLVSYGDPASYARLAEMLAGFDCLVRLMPGNWDERGALREQFPDVVPDSEFVQFEVKLPGLRLLALDTTEPGRHGGAFCESRAAWLSERLSADPETPVLIAMHHPPIVSGLDWLDGSGKEAWITRFRGAIAGHRQVRQIITGHLHRTVHTLIDGVPLLVCPSTAPAVTLDLGEFDPARPDGRVMVDATPPGYALHRFVGDELVSHIGWAAAEPWEVLAAFDDGMQPTVANNLAERE